MYNALVMQKWSEFPVPYSAHANSATLEAV